MLTLLLLAQELTPDTFEKWREYVRPSEAETRWERVPWRAEFWGAVVEATEQKKPILLWAMNGHPLACT